MSFPHMTSKGGAGVVCIPPGPRVGLPVTAPPYPDQLPLVDPSALLQMQEELNSPAAARDFARDFARIWEKRFARLAGAIASGDQSCRDAILSVKTASIMVGAARLACLAAEVEDLVRQPGAAVPETLLQELEACGLLTIAELEATFLAPGR